MKGFPFPASSGVKYGTVSQAWEPAYEDASLKTEQVVFRNLRSPLCLVIREQGTGFSSGLVTFGPELLF